MHCTQWKNISHRLREIRHIFTDNVRIGDKKKSSASLLEIEIRLTVSSHMNITRRCQRVGLRIVQTSSYNAAHQVRYKGTCTYASRTKIYTMHTEASPRTRCYNPALGATLAMIYRKGGCYHVPARATVWVFPYPSNGYSLGFTPEQRVFLVS